VSQLLECPVMLPSLSTEDHGMSPLTARTRTRTLDQDSAILKLPSVVEARSVGRRRTVRLAHGISPTKELPPPATSVSASPSLPSASPSPLKQECSFRRRGTVLETPDTVRIAQAPFTVGPEEEEY